MERRDVIGPLPQGATPIDDISGLIPSNRVTNRLELDRAEAANIREAVDQYLLRSVRHPKHRINEEELRKIHWTMFNQVWAWAGSFRTRGFKNIGVKSYLIRIETKKLCDDVLFSWCSDAHSQMDSLEQAARIHCRLAWIHPFENGNGRFARLVADRYLKALKQRIPQWPSGLGKDSPVRKEYLSAIREADRGNVQPLMDFTDQWRT